MIIREIKPEDNKAVAILVRAVFDELNIPKTGTAYEDKSLDEMYENYQLPRTRYFVVEHEGKVIGGAGVGALSDSDTHICELQKMYFLPAARGKGVGSAMLEKCIETARQFGYQQCYLETLPEMVAAQTLYKKFGFDYITEPMGCTGHTTCDVWMLKQL